MDGPLYKWTNYINGWQQRYFTLRKGILSYYASESDVDTGCKGAFTVSACEVCVHPTDACRFDILIPGEQRYYLKAATSQERQRWIVAIGSCKAGITNVDDFQKMQKAEKLIEAKRSELRINRDLLFQQVHGICGALKSKAGENKEIIEAVNSLKATCNTFLVSADELILLLNTGRHKSSHHLSTTSTVGSPLNGRVSSTLPPSLQSMDVNASPRVSLSGASPPPPTSSEFTESPSSDSADKTTKLIEQIATTAVSTSEKPRSQKTSRAQLSNHLRGLRLTRLHPTFLSSMEFSFEDLVLSQTTSAVEFLACTRSLLKFFGSLASCDKMGNPILTRLGCLQTVYADMLGNVVRLELAVKNLASSADAGGVDVREKSLSITLADIVDAEQRSKQCRVSGSAYLALLWLARALNFSAEFLSLLYQDTTALRTNTNTNAFVEQVATEAYTRTLREFHDWSVRGTATVILKAVPTFERIHNALLLIDESQADQLTPPPEALAQLHLDVERFADALRKCLQAIHAMFLQRGLDPVFSGCPQSEQ